MKIWLIGDRGMLGTELSLLLEKKGIEFVGSDREVDIRDIEALRVFARASFPAGGPDWVVNCSAYTAVDKAEEEEGLARQINAVGAGNIASLAHELGAALIHISTDYVFDGQGIRGADGELRPYVETDDARPAGAYGRTKLEGEVLARDACPRHFIVRTAWLYGLHGPNFVYTMLRLMRQKDSIGVVADQWGSPTWAYDLARAIAFLVESGSRAYGVYHFTNEGMTNWHGFASEIHRLGLSSGILAKPCEVRAITSAEYPSKDKRPAWSVLSKEKIAALGAEVPFWQDSLAAFMDACASLKRRQEAWMWHVRYDIETAECDFAAGRYLAVMFWCQQAIEKLLKACLEEYERPLPGHSLLKQAMKLRLDLSGDQRLLLKELEFYYISSRNEEDTKLLASSLVPDVCGSILSRAKEFIAWLKQRVRFLGE